MAMWLAMSIKHGERNTVLHGPGKTFMDLLEKVMAQSTSKYTAM